MGINQYIKIGSKIKKARLSKGIRQKDMAEKLELSVSTYSNYENNYREPKLDIVEKICSILDMTIDELVDFPINGTESSSADSLPYDQSYSYASSEEKGNQIDLEKKEHNNVDKYDASIRISHNLSPETIENLKQISVIYKKIKNGEKLTRNELQVLKDYNQRQETAGKRLKKKAQEHLEYLKKLQTAYEQLNNIGQKKALERIEELTEIPKYIEPDEPPQE